MRVLPVILLTISFIHWFQTGLAQDDIWGVTAEGGKYDLGCIFKTDQDGNNQQIVHSFSKPTGIFPKGGHPVELDNGKIYGLLTSNDDHSLIIFEYDPIEDYYSIIYNHTDNDFGYEPSGGLIKGENGTLYGMTTLGGEFDAGVIFKFNTIDKKYAVSYHFSDFYGSQPYGRLCKANNGICYGMTHSGGMSNEGVIFGFNFVNNTYTKLFEFNSEETGSYPRGHLIQGSDGMLYGLTSRGGKNDSGTLFKYDPVSGILENLLDFSGKDMGGNPYGGLIEVGDLIFYGLTYKGGSYLMGTLFEFDALSKRLQVLNHFNGEDGSYPIGSLVLNNQNILVGMTYKGGDNDYGTLFEYNLDDKSFSKKVDFSGKETGKYPMGDILLTSNGKYFSYCLNGGKYDQGVLFEYNTSKEIIIHIDYNEKYDGYYPVKIIYGDDGKIYGINQGGGQFNQGTLFQFDPVSYSIKKLHNFQTENTLLIPNDIIYASNGDLYGIVSSDYSSRGSLLYQFNINKQFYSVIDTSFNGPLVTLMETIDQKIMVNQIYSGTSYWNGEIYNESYSRFYYFDLHTNKFLSSNFIFFGNSYGNLLCTMNEKCYMMICEDNHGSGMGEIRFKNYYYDDFRYYQYDDYVKIIDFNGPEKGAFPKGSLIESQNGNIYGFTSMGGIFDQGVIFEISSYNNNFKKLFDFECDESGCYPEGRLLESSNGKLYGITSKGGSYNYGILFEFDPHTANFSKKFDFNRKNGKRPIKSNLIINKYDEITDLNDHVELNNSIIELYPNPTENILHINLGERQSEVIISIHTLQGEEILSQEFLNQQIININTEVFDPGMYIIMVDIGYKNQVEKIIIR